MTAATKGCMTRQSHRPMSHITRSSSQDGITHGTTSLILEHSPARLDHCRNSRCWAGIVNIIQIGLSSRRKQAPIRFVYTARYHLKTLRRIKSISKRGMTKDYRRAKGMRLCNRTLTWYSAFQLRSSLAEMRATACLLANGLLSLLRDSPL